MINELTLYCAGVGPPVATSTSSSLAVTIVVVVGWAGPPAAPRWYEHRREALFV